MNKITLTPQHILHRYLWCIIIAKIKTFYRSFLPWLQYWFRSLVCHQRLSNLHFVLKNWSLLCWWYDTNQACIVCIPHTERPEKRRLMKSIRQSISALAYDCILVGLNIKNIVNTFFENGCIVHLYMHKHESVNIWWR